MAVAKTLEDIITEQAPIVCEQVEAAVSFADSEEDLRIEFEKAIEVFRKEADLPELKGHHEVTIGKGRADSVYDYVFIEYKKPGRLKESNDTPGNREVIKQLQERAKAFKSGHPFVDRMLKSCGDVGFGGYCTKRWVKSPRVGSVCGYAFNFIVRQRIHRNDHEEFLFSLHPLFVTDDGTTDDAAARASLESYSDPLTKEIHVRLGPDEAFEIAKGRLQKEVQSIWDWDEDVSLLNLAVVAFAV